MHFVKPAALGIACFLLGAVVTRYYDTHRRTTQQTAETAKAPAGAGQGAEVAKIDFKTSRCGHMASRGLRFPAKKLFRRILQAGTCVRMKILWSKRSSCIYPAPAR